MNARPAQGGPTLAVTGSNLVGGVPFAAALQLGLDVHERRSPAGARGDLARLCAELCTAHGLEPAAVGRIVVDVGPGSYTGLRVALTFVRFLQAFAGVEVFAVDSLAVLAMVGRRERGAARLRPLLDARRGRVHTAGYLLADGELREIEAPAALPAAVALARVAADELIVAPAALLAGLGDAVPVARAVAAPEVTAADLLLPGLPRFVAGPADLEPRYLMASYAEP